MKDQMAAALEVYRKASALSYVGQNDEIIVPVAPGQITGVTLGFQPHGIVSRENDDGMVQVAGAAYFEPAAYFADVSEVANSLGLKVSWMHGAELRQEFVDGAVPTGRCGFPDIDPIGGANRCCTVNFGGTEGSLYVTRDNDRNLYQIVPPTNERKRWRLFRRYPVPSPTGGEWKTISSALMEDDGGILHVIETDGVDTWRLSSYDNLGDEKGYVQTSSQPIPRLRYGVGLTKSGQPATVTAYGTEEPPGVYFGDKRVVPNVYGTGICFLPGIGGALVACYGKNYAGQSGGLPGTLSYIPPELFPEGTF